MAFFISKKAQIFFLITLVAALGLALLYSDNGILQLNQLKQDKEKMQSEIQSLKDENQRLLKYIERLKNDPRCIEDEARKKLGLVKPNETIYRLQEETETTDGSVPLQ